MTRTRSPLLSIVPLILFCIGVYTPYAAAGQYPDTIWVPVIYYDYHTDYGNSDYIPDFQFDGRPGCGNNISIGETGYVQKTLDDELKPVFKENIGCNAHIDEWYRPSGASGPSTVSEFVYMDSIGQWRWTNMEPYRGRPGEYVSQDYDENYNFRTIVIYDSLPFIHIGGENKPAQSGMYQFSRLGEASDPTFNPISNRGYGNEITGFSPEDTVNYSFAMEIQMEFEYRKGLTFSFNGDDDVFVFIEDTLMLELGGPHNPVQDSFTLDALGDRLGLQEGEMAHFSFFYAERNSAGSNIQVTTNLLHDIDRLEIQATGLDITAGNVITLNAQLADEFGNPIPPSDTAYNNVTWSLISDGRRPGDEIVGDDSLGADVDLTGTQAHRFYMVEAVYRDPDDSTKVIRDTAFIPVEPADPYRITLERDSIISTADSNEWYPDDLVYDTIGTDEQAVRMYAFVRDSFGNIIERGTIDDPTSINNPQGADNAQWRQEPGTNDRFMTVRPYNAQTRWIGVAERTSGAGADSRVIVSQDGLIPDTCWIHQAFRSAGPVLTGARYYSFLDAQWNDHDTLVLTFAEPVVWPDPTTLEQNLGSVFALYDASTDVLDTTVFGDNTAFAIRRPLDSVGTTITLLVQHGYGTEHITPAEDSIVLLPEPDQYLKDTQGSEVQDTSRALVKTRPSWNVRVWKSPLDPANPHYDSLSLADIGIEPLSGSFDVDRFNEMQSLMTHNKGLYGIIKSTTTLTEGSVTIIDALGNVIARGVPVAYSPDTGDYVFVWNGLNRNNRRVAAGTYLAIIETTSEDGSTSTQNVKFGIDYSAGDE